MNKRISYEEACKISDTLITTERLDQLGPVECMKAFHEAMKKVGWTIEELINESENRTAAKIAKMAVAGYAMSNWVDTINNSYEAENAGSQPKPR